MFCIDYHKQPAVLIPQGDRDSKFLKTFEQWREMTFRRPRHQQKQQPNDHRPWEAFSDFWH
jgi:hypothetical protein